MLTSQLPGVYRPLSDAEIQHLLDVQLPPHRALMARLLSELRERRERLEEIESMAHNESGG